MVALLHSLSDCSLAINSLGFDCRKSMLNIEVDWFINSPGMNTRIKGSTCSEGQNPAGRVLAREAGNFPI